MMGRWEQGERNFKFGDTVTTHKGYDIFTDGASKFKWIYGVWRDSIIDVCNDIDFYLEKQNK